MTHGIPGSTLNFQLLPWRSEQWHQILHLRQDEYRECSPSGVQLVFGVLQYSTASLQSFGHIWTWSTPLPATSFWSRCDLFRSIYHSPMNNLGVDVYSGCGISCIRSNFLREFCVDQCSTTHRYCALPNCPNSFLFVSRRQCIFPELGVMTLSLHAIVLWA